MNGSKEDFDIHAPQWDSPTVAGIAGVEQQVLLGWRRRHRFLGGSKPGRPGYLHSFVETLVAVSVAAMVRRGFNVEDAIMAESDLTAVFTDILENGPEVASNVFGFHAKGRDPKVKASFYHLGRDQTLGEALDKSPTGSMQILDLQRIVDHVVRKLKIRSL